MRESTAVIAVVFTIVTAIVAVPLSDMEVHNAPSVNSLNNGRSVGTNGLQVKSVIQLHHLSSLRMRDYFADLISSTLGMSVKELLARVDTTFKDLDRVTKQGVEALEKVESMASPEIVRELEAIKNNAISKVFETVAVFIKDLGRVLPVLQPRSSNASDIIYALLGKTLEDLVIAIEYAFECSLQLLRSTIADFKALAAKATPEVRTELNKIVDQYLNRGQTIITPMLTLLRQVVDSSANRVALRRNTSPQNGYLLDRIVSKLLEIDIESVARDADAVVSQLVPLVKTTREELINALQNAHTTNATDEVLATVLKIYDDAVEELIRDTKPILNALLQFEETSRRRKTFVNDLSVTLLGISADAFKEYIQNASVNTNSTVIRASGQMIASSMQAGLPVAFKVRNILHTSLTSASIISEPLVESLRSIVQQKHIDEVFNPEEGEWSEPDGVSYNRDAIINGASEVLGFKVSEATKTLKTALENLDELTETSLVDLEGMLTDVNANLRMDILKIMNETLTDIHITLQPMLDVLLPFLPDDIRQNKDVALDIYSHTNEVKVDFFLRYCSFVSTRIPAIADLATIRIKTRAARAGPTIHGKITALLAVTDDRTKGIIQPFLEIVGPIISPR